MKKAGLIIFGLLLLTGIGFSQDFKFPPVTNNVESIKAGFWALVINAKDLGHIERDLSWTYSQESITRHYIEYMDNALANMTYEKVKAYVESIRSNIERLNRQSIPKSVETDFERYMGLAYPNYNYEVDRMMDVYKGKPFPPEIVLNYDKTRLESFDAQIKKNESDLIEARAQLESLPTLDELRAQLNANRNEQNKPENQRDRQRLQQLKNEETNIQNQLSQTFIKRDNLTKSIRTLENNLTSAEANRNRIASETETPARRAYINSLYASLYNFSAWEAFFKGESSDIRNFFILNSARANLSSLVDEIPQGDAPVYKAKTNSLLAGWGL